MNRLTTLSLAGLAVLTAAPALAQAPAGDAAKGKAVFDRNCAACHGPGIHAGHLLPGSASLQAKYGGKEPPALEDRKDLAPAYVAFVVRHGAEGMPFFRPTEVSNQDLADLGAYLARNNR